MLKLIFWVFVLFLALSFFGISIQAIINSPTGQENFNYLYHSLILAWQYLQTFLAQGWQWSTFWIRPA